MTQHSGPSRAPRREAQEGEVQEEKQQASSAQSRPPGRAGRRVSRELRPELQGSGGRPWPTRRRTLLKGKGGPPRAPAPASRAPPRAGPRDGNKGAKRVSPQQPGRPQLELGSRSRDSAGHPGSRPPGWPFRPRKALPPPYPLSSYPGLSSQTAPVQLQAGRGQSQARPRPSSYQEAAGRAGRAGQAAQEKPRLVPPLPPWGPGDREARGSPDRLQPAHVRSPARGSSGLKLRGSRGAAGGGRPRPSRSRRGKGGGSNESGAGKLRRAAELGEGGANRLSRQRPRRPPRGALRRPVGPRRSSANLGRRATGRVAATTGTVWPRGPRTPLSGVAFRSYALAPLRFAGNASTLSAPQHTGARTLSLFCTVPTHLACSCC
ncbi:translation initiation factor IF-2-like [Lynx canadensis]|uniref:translation initiation factor IF-2-like n=1 Tax=Lynx canadensis TaxID=61383 RepID=UPI0013C525DA|nr:translation initiation factor IF-2-like [Lynx canadensis]